MEKPNQIRFDIRSSLDSPTLTLRLVGIKRAIPEKSLVLYSPGMRACGGWGYSEPLQGAYRYVSPDSSGQEFSFGIEGIDSFVADGIVLVLSTFGKLNCPLKDVVEFVAIDIHGFEKGTCEECVESYEMSLPSASSAKSLVPTSNQFVGRRSGEVVARSGSSRMRAQIKRIPGAVTLYRTLKG